MESNTITKGIYDHKIYQNKGNADVISQITDQHMNILHIGCGSGDNAQILKQLAGRFVVGVTISADEAAMAKTVCDDVIVANIETDSLPVDRRFDVIILSHVCEHLVYPTIALEKVSEHLADNGIIIVAVPNLAFYRCRFKLLKGDWTMNDTGPFDRTHLHFYSYNSADTLANSYKLKIDKKIAGFLAVPLWPLRKLLPGFCKKIDGFLGNIFPNLFAQQIVLVIKKSI